MFFIVRRDQKPGRLAMAWGPYPDRGAALAAAKAISLPGEYVIYGPAEPSATVKIDAPKTTVTEAA